MSDLIERLRRWNMAEAGGDTTQSVMRDLNEAADEIERLRAVVRAAERLYSGGLYPENHEYVLISDRSLDALDEALAAYDQSSG